MASLRVLLVSFKFLSAYDVLRAACVSHLWFQASESPELWLDQLQTHSEMLISPAVLQRSPRLKDLYQQLYTDPFIPTIIGDAYMRFSVRKETYTVRKIANTKLTKASYLLLLPDKSVFACGGDTRSEEFYDFGLDVAYRVFVLEGEVEELQGMLQPRRYPCSYFYRNTVFVFGGAHNTSMLNTAEEYHITAKQWSKLPNMHASRCSTTPCMSGNKIYLLGGYPSTTGEVYDVEERKFEMLALTLPSQADCVTAIVNETMHIFTYKTAISLTLPALTPLFAFPINSDNFVWSHSKPVIDNHIIWFYYWHREAIASYNTVKKQFSLHKCLTYNELAAQTKAKT